MSSLEGSHLSYSESWTIVVSKKT